MCSIIPPCPDRSACRHLKCKQRQMSRQRIRGPHQWGKVSTSRTACVTVTTHHVRVDAANGSTQTCSVRAEPHSITHSTAQHSSALTFGRNSTDPSTFCPPANTNGSNPSTLILSNASLFRISCRWLSTKVSSVMTETGCGQSNEADCVRTVAPPISPGMGLVGKITHNDG